ncbi:MAG: ABC transporter substrate-binding protein [Deltaproteobacteria bacterium]|jgi:peptide/nickel transport system substrate-binding protein|nr:ABC transporter substrate-binding protein [Deltaproteobacteria bacterium]
MSKIRAFIASFSAFGLALALAASPLTAAGKTDVIISMDSGSSSPTIGFDPILGWGSGEHTHDPLFQSTLLVTNDDITIGYDLAKEYSISDDGLTWTFKIRDDVKFTDGQKLTAKDVAFTYNSAMKQAIEADLSMLDRVEATDDTTAVFHFKRPYSAFAYIAAVFGIVPEHAYNPSTYGANPIGSGRYILKQWDKGEQVIMEANPDYYGRKPKITKVTVVFMTEDASYAAAKAGAVDVAYTEAPYTVNPVDGYKIVAFNSVDIRGINFPVIPSGNTHKSQSGEELPAGNNVTANKALRQAIAYAIDRDSIVKNVLGGYGKVSFSECLGEPWENPAMAIQTDKAKAIKLLEDDGWKKGSDGFYAKDGLKAEFDLLYISSNSARTGIAMAVTEMLKEIGIKVNPVGSSWDQIHPQTYTTPHVFGAGMHSPSGVISHYYTGYNSASYSNPTVDSYIDQALAAKTVPDSYPLFQKAQWDGQTGVTPYGDAPWTWIAAVDHIYFARNGLNIVDKKIHPHGYGWTITNNVDQWYWD